MRFWRIDYKVADSEMVAGEKPYNMIKSTIDPLIEAEDENEAIEVALDLLFEEIDSCYYPDINYKSQEMTIYDYHPNDGGKVVQLYWGFEAKEVDENGIYIEEVRDIEMD